MAGLGRVLMVIGILVFSAGGLIYMASRLNIPLGRLPGDIRYSTENFTCVFPLVSMILVSIFLSVVLNFIYRLINR